jgi:hypothetical protein
VLPQCPAKLAFRLLQGLDRDRIGVRHVSRHGRAMPARRCGRNCIAQSLSASCALNEQRSTSLHLQTIFVVVAVLLIHRTSPSLRSCRFESPLQRRPAWLTKPCRGSGETSVTCLTLAAQEASGRATTGPHPVQASEIRAGRVAGSPPHGGAD